MRANRSRYHHAWGKSVRPVHCESLEPRRLLSITTSPIDAGSVPNQLTTVGNQTFFVSAGGR